MRYVNTSKIHIDNPLKHALYTIALLEFGLKRSRNSLSLCKSIQRATALNHELCMLNFLQPHITFCVDWDSLMAKQNNRPSFNLIDYRLNDAELDAYEKSIEKSIPTLTQLLSDFAEKDYKISMSFVENSQAWCISITGKEDAKFNSSSTLTTWSDDPMDGLAMAHFKVFVVFNGGVWKTKEQSRRG